MCPREETEGMTMNKQQIDPTLMQKIMEDDDSEIRVELEQKLEAELAKPEDEIDYALVTELSEALCTTYGVSEVELARGKEKCIARLFPKQTYWKHIVNKWLKPLAVCMIAICSLLFVTHLPMRSLGVDLISEVVSIADGSVTLLLDGSRNAHLQPAKGQEDPLGIADDLEILGIPAFLPSDVAGDLEEMGRTIDQDMDQTEMTVWYRLDQGSLIFSTAVIHDTDDMKNICGVPTETYQLKQEECNGLYMITLEEEDRYHAVFAVGNARYSFSMYGLDFSICHAIIESILTEPATRESTKKEPDA